MKGYRIATHLDYAYILRLLVSGDKEGVLVRSLFRNNVKPYPLLEISKGPYSLKLEGLVGFSAGNEECVICITDSLLHNVKMKRGDAEWVAPEMSSVILLVPE